jgi:hypothetical protein
MNGARPVEGAVLAWIGQNIKDALRWCIDDSFDRNGARFHLFSLEITRRDWAVVRSPSR